MGDPVTMAVIAAGAQMASAATQATGTILQGKAGVSAARTEENMLNAQGGEQLAIATREAAAKQREADLLTSNLQATAADSGGSATDAGVLELKGGIASEASVQKREAIRQGMEARNQALYRGKLGVQAAKQNQKLGYLTAAGQLLSGASSAFSAYGGKGPPKPGSGTASSPTLLGSTEPYANWTQRTI